MLIAKTERKENPRWHGKSKFGRSLSWIESERRMWVSKIWVGAIGILKKGGWNKVREKWLFDRLEKHWWKRDAMEVGCRTGICFAITDHQYYIQTFAFGFSTAHGRYKYLGSLAKWYKCFPIFIQLMFQSIKRFSPTWDRRTRKVFILLKTLCYHRLHD